MKVKELIRILTEQYPADAEVLIPYQYTGLKPVTDTKYSILENAVELVAD